MDPDNCPQSLQNKVQFDICFFICRRENENLYDMNKATFALKMDEATKIRYIVKAHDKLDKNHSEKSTEIVSSAMPEMPNNPLCPVESFLKYLDCLHPECLYLWQHAKTPQEAKNPKCKFFYNKRVSENTLASFMSNLSHL